MMARFVGQELVAVMIVVALVLALLQPSMASSHHKKHHGRLRNHATAAASRTVRKLSTSGPDALGGHELEKGSMPSAIARASTTERDVGDNKMQWTSDHADQESQDRTNVERSSMNGDEFSGSIEDDASGGLERASSNGELGRVRSVSKVVDDERKSAGLSRSTFTRSKDMEGLGNIEAAAHSSVLEKEQMVRDLKKPALTIPHKQSN